MYPFVLADNALKGFEHPEPTPDHHSAGRARSESRRLELVNLSAVALYEELFFQTANFIAACRNISGFSAQSAISGGPLAGGTEAGHVQKLVAVCLGENIAAGTVGEGAVVLAAYLRISLQWTVAYLATRTQAPT